MLPGIDSYCRAKDAFAGLTPARGKIFVSYVNLYRNLRGTDISREAPEGHYRRFASGRGVEREVPAERSLTTAADHRAICIRARIYACRREANSTRLSALEQESVVWRFDYRRVSARMRTGPSTSPSSFMGATTTTAPASGTRSRFATF